MADFGVKSAPCLTYRFPVYNCISFNLKFCYDMPSYKNILKGTYIITIYVSDKLNDFGSVTVLHLF
jgi:methionyl aminopeptidase